MGYKQRGRLTPWLRSRSFLPWFVLAVWTLPALGNTVPVVKSVTATSVRVTIHLSAPVAFQHATLPEASRQELPARCYVDLSPATLGKHVSSRINVDSPLVRRVRTAQYRPGTARVVLDLSVAQACHVQALTNPDQLEVSVGSPPSNTAPEAGMTGARSAEVPPAVSVQVASRDPVDQVTSTAAVTQDVETGKLSSHGQSFQGRSRFAVTSAELSEPTGPDVVLLQLKEALDIALTQHPTLRRGKATVEAAQQRVRQEMAGYLPRGVYTYRYTRQQVPFTAAVGGVDVGGGPQTRMISQTFPFNAMSVNLSQLLFDFGRTLATIRSAAAAVEASRADLEVTRQTVIFNTKQAYYSLLSAQRLQEVAEETVRQNLQHLDEAQAHFEVGLAPRFDVTQARVQLSNAELDRVTARNNVALARETLRTAMGITGPFLFTLVDVLDRQGVAFDDEALVTQAYTNRPELRSLQAQREAATAHLLALQKQYLPSVAGELQYSWTGRAHPLQGGWLWGVTLNFPLFDDILTNAQVGEARAEVRRLEAEEENIRQQVVLEVRQSFLNLRQAEERIRVSEQILVQARDNLDLAQGRYAAGVGNIIEVTDAQVSLTSARARNVEALYSYKTTLAELEKATGQRLE